MVLENIGEGDDALRCMTDFRNRPPYNDPIGDGWRTLGNWFFPNGTRVRSSGNQWDIYRTRGQSVVLLHRRRGGAEGIYRCEIPDTMNVIQTMYIRVYNTAGKPLPTHQYGHYICCYKFIIDTVTEIKSVHVHVYV